MSVELSVMEQRYQAVSPVVHEVESEAEVSCRFDVSREVVHRGRHRHP